MQRAFLHRLGSVLWVGLVVVVVTLAAYVSAGRLLTANLANFRTDILQALNARSPIGIEAEQVSGEWQSFTPAIVLTGLRITLPGSANPPLELSRGRIAVDVLNSLRTGSLQMTRLVLDGLSLQGEMTRDGKFRLVGFGVGDEGQSAPPLREFLLNIERVSLRKNSLVLTLPHGGVRELGLDLELSREGSERTVQASLTSSTGARIAVHAQGQGDPFKPQEFVGEVYADIQSTNLGVIKELFADRTFPVWADGAADLEVWFNWVRGMPSMRARLEANDLVVAAEDTSWQLSLERMSLAAQLVQHKNRWTVHMADLQVENDDVVWTLPQLQLDSQGNGLQVRTAGFELESLNTIFTDQNDLPATLRDVFATLRLRGKVTALQLGFDNIYQPADDWRLAANFEDVAVESFHGAPGATSITGYAQLGAGGGEVILDSQATSLDFPSVYSEPLLFHDLYGSLRLYWNDEQVKLASGLLTTHGDEGTAKVLFGLNIPLHASEVGIEMDLLVGLQDTQSVHRAKFIPYILAPGLLGWLADSIGDGLVEQGAFVWRGSLRAGSAPLHTVQLAFNVANTQLRYHPQWPAVLVEEGIVLINDSAVSVWAERARLFDSRVDDLSVETRINTVDQLTLDVQGHIQGPAGDGFKVLHESPLAQIVGPAFAGWTADGMLDTDLQFHLNLSDTSVPPRVDVATRWHDVDLSVMPGNLQLQAVNGEFAYSTMTGFSANALTGTLWGNAVNATLQQHHGNPGDTYSAADTVLDIRLATQVELADLSRWLNLSSLGFASGRTVADINIRLAPAEPVFLTVDSNLQGVTLDLPQPWQKPADDPQHLHLAMSLTGDVMPLSLALGEQLKLQLDVENGTVRSGAVGINEPPPPTEAGVLKVTGHIDMLQGDEWLRLARQYFSAPGTEEPVGPVAQTPTGIPFTIAVDELRADSVQILAQEIRNVVFSLALDHSQWQLQLATDWLRGELSRAEPDSPVRVVIEYLDLDRVPDFSPSGEGGDVSWEMPALNVSLRNLYQSRQRLGELSFVLQQESNVLTADTITGELAGLGLRNGLPGRLVWHRGPEPYTELQATLNFADLGLTLEYFDYQRTVQTQDGAITLDLHWPNAPQDFSLSEAQGDMQVQIGSGSFLDAPTGATEALRVVSILNLADIVRRLSLSNMFKSGIPFDSVQGEVEVGDGKLTVARINVQGGSSFQFSGVSDIQARDLDGELVATLPVVSNLPWIAAVAASLPVAAGVYVVGQVFNRQMNRLSSVVYSITGTWDDPEVDFDRFFDNTPDTAPIQSD